MKKGEEGFTLVELMITMAIIALSLAAASSVFTAILTQFKQQSKIAETSIEGVIGLEIMRQDIEGAGYGLPWDLANAIYQEASAESRTPWVDQNMNDGPPNNPARGSDIAGASNPPAAFRSLVGTTLAGALNGSDVISVKSVAVAQNGTSQRWTQQALGDNKKNGLSGDMFSNSDLVTVLYANGRTHVLIHNSSSAWSARYSSTASFAPGPSGAGTSDLAQTYPEIGDSQAPPVFIVYGIDPGTNATSLRFPFNRADFYIRKPDTNFPKRCATGTGILYKGIFSQSDGMIVNELPLLDCAAAMRVVFGLDTNNNGNISYTDNIANMTAADLRTQLREVRVYILAQEGQRDPNYTYPSSNVIVGEAGMWPLTVDMTKITDYQNYRWKQYSLIVQPTNLR